MDAVVVRPEGLRGVTEVNVDSSGEDGVEGVSRLVGGGDDELHQSDVGEVV